MRLEHLSRAEARMAALRAFGNPTLVQTRSREVWEWSRLEAFLVDLKLVPRRLLRSPGSAVTVLLTLSIGIGANTAVFSVVDSVLLKPLPYPESDRLVTLSLQAPGAAGLTSFRDGLLPARVSLRPSLRSYFRAPHSRSASASSSAFSVSSTVDRTTSSRWAWIRPSSICTAGPATGFTPSPDPASLVASIFFASEVSLLQLVPTFTVQNQMCERNRTLSRDQECPIESPPAAIE